MKTKSLSETLVMKSLARRERRRNTTYNDGQGQGWITVVTNTEIKNNVTIVSESPKTYIDFYGNEAISSSTIFTVKIKYNKYKRVKKKRK